MVESVENNHETHFGAFSYSGMVQRHTISKWKEILELTTVFAAGIRLNSISRKFWATAKTWDLKNLIGDIGLPRLKR